MRPVLAVTAFAVCLIAAIAYAGEPSTENFDFILPAASLDGGIYQMTGSNTTTFGAARVLNVDFQQTIAVDKLDLSGNWVMQTSTPG